MLYLPILVPQFWQQNMVPKYAQVGRYKGEHPWDGHGGGMEEENVPKIGYGL